MPLYMLRPNVLKQQKRMRLTDFTIQNVPAIADKKILKIGYDDIMDYGARDISTVGVLANFLYSE